MVDTDGVFQDNGWPMAFFSDSPGQWLKVAELFCLWTYHFSSYPPVFTRQKIPIKMDDSSIKKPSLGLGISPLWFLGCLPGNLQWWIHPSTQRLWCRGLSRLCCVAWMVKITYPEVSRGLEVCLAVSNHHNDDPWDVKTVKEVFLMDSYI